MRKATVWFAASAAAFAPLLIAGGPVMAQAPACGTSTLPISVSECDSSDTNPNGTLPSEFQQRAGVGDDLKDWWTDNQWKPGRPGDAGSGSPASPTNRTDPQYDCQDSLGCW